MKIVNKQPIIQQQRKIILQENWQKDNASRNSGLFLQWCNWKGECNTQFDFVLSTFGFLVVEKQGQKNKEKSDTFFSCNVSKLNVR